MTWFKVDDRFPEHSKLEALEHDPRGWAEALAVWLVAGCHAAGNLTDGLIARSRLERITPMGKRASKVADQLVELGLWERTDKGYKFHDWFDWQPSAEEVEYQRERNAAKQRAIRDRRREQDTGNRLQPAKSNRLPPEEVTGAVTMSRPVPSRPDQIKEEREMAPPDFLAPVDITNRLRARGWDLPLCPEDRMRGLLPAPATPEHVDYTASYAEEVTGKSSGTFSYFLKMLPDVITGKHRPNGVKQQPEPGWIEGSRKFLEEVGT